MPDTRQPPGQRPRQRIDALDRRRAGTACWWSSLSLTDAFYRPVRRRAITRCWLVTLNGVAGRSSHQRYYAGPCITRCRDRFDRVLNRLIDRVCFLSSSTPAADGARCSGISATWSRLSGSLFIHRQDRDLLDLARCWSRHLGAGARRCWGRAVAVQAGRLWCWGARPRSAAADWVEELLFGSVARELARSTTSAAAWWGCT